MISPFAARRFNGKGEYTFVRVLDKNNKAGCEVQARTGQPDGKEVKATVFTAFLLTCPTQNDFVQSIEVRLNKDTGRQLEELYHGLLKYIMNVTDHF